MDTRPGSRLLLPGDACHAGFGYLFSWAVKEGTFPMPTYLPDSGRFFTLWVWIKTDALLFWLLLDRCCLIHGSADFVFSLCAFFFFFFFFFFFVSAHSPHSWRKTKKEKEKKKMCLSTCLAVYPHKLCWACVSVLSIHPRPPPLLFPKPCLPTVSVNLCALCGCTALYVLQGRSQCLWFCCAANGSVVSALSCGEFGVLSPCARLLFGHKICRLGARIV